MTGTSVKDVGQLAVNLVPAPSAKSPSVGKQDQFQKVFEKQTAKAQRDDKSELDNRGGFQEKEACAESGTTVSENKAPVKKDSLSGKQQKTVEEKPDTGKAQIQTAKDPAETEQDVGELLQGYIMQMVQTIADAFGASPQEVQEVMQDMGIEGTQLLSPEPLSALIVAMGQESDASALLTNEPLYQNFRSVMELQETLAGEIRDEFGIRVEQLGQQTQPEVQAQTPDSVQEATPAQEVQAGMQTQAPTPEREAQTQPQREEKPAKEPVADAQSETAKEPVQTQTPEAVRAPERRHKEESGAHHEMHQGQEPMFRPGTVETSPQAYQPELSENPLSDVDTQNIMRQILDYMKVQIRPELTHMEMQLHPESLGTLQVQLASKGGVVTAQFIAQDESVKAVLENQMIQLQESFEQQGVKVEAIEVSVQTGSFDQGLQQEAESQQQQPQEKGKVRRIHLGPAPEGRALEELTEEEQLAASVMEANGNTVDYMA